MHETFALPCEKISLSEKFGHPELLQYRDYVILFGQSLSRKFQFQILVHSSVTKGVFSTAFLETAAQIPQQIIEEERDIIALKFLLASYLRFNGLIKVIGNIRWRSLVPRPLMVTICVSVQNLDHGQLLDELLVSGHEYGTQTQN